MGIRGNGRLLISEKKINTTKCVALRLKQSYVDHVCAKKRSHIRKKEQKKKERNVQCRAVIQCNVISVKVC